MTSLKEYKEQLLIRGKEHTLVLNGVTYNLVVNKMLLMCRWSTDAVKAGGSNLFSNAYTLDEVASYMKNVCNKLTEDKTQHKHHQTVLEELMFLVAENGDARP